MGPGFCGAAALRAKAREGVEVRVGAWAAAAAAAERRWASGRAARDADEASDSSCSSNDGNVELGGGAMRGAASKVHVEIRISIKLCRLRLPDGYVERGSLTILPFCTESCRILRCRLLCRDVRRRRLVPQSALLALALVLVVASVLFFAEDPSVQMGPRGSSGSRRRQRQQTARLTMQQLGRNYRQIGIDEVMRGTQTLRTP